MIWPRGFVNLFKETLTAGVSSMHIIFQCVVWEFINTEAAPGSIGACVCGDPGVGARGGGGGVVGVVGGRLECLSCESRSQ